MRAPTEATIFVTGATDGLGKRVALELADRGATVLVHGRSRERCETVLKEVRRGTGSEGARYYLADLSSLSEVRRLAEEILSEHEETVDGVELTFAVNYLAHFLLTNLLLPLLLGSAPARVVNVASAGQSPVNFRDVMLKQGYGGMKAYTQSKLAQVMFTFELAQRLRGTGVTVNALHPATLMDTKMVRETFGHASSTVQDGTEAVVRLAASPELEAVTGRYFDGMREARADRQAHDAAARKRLWDLSEKWCEGFLQPLARRQ